MIAVNFEGKIIVNKAMEIRTKNKLLLIELIRAAIFIMNSDLELAKEQIIQAYELTQESLSNTFICVDGLTPLVVNELADARNYNQLTIIHDQLYEEIYVQFFILAKEKLNGTNVLSFQRAKIHRSLLNIYNEVCLIEPL